MEVLYLLIPIAIVLVLIMAALFLWAINSNQFEDIERHGSDILFDDDEVDGQVNTTEIDKKIDDNNKQ